MVRLKPLLAGLVLGVAPVLVLYVDGFWDLQLVFFVWLSFTVTGWFIGRDGLKSWGENQRWTALQVLLVVGGAQLGVHMDLPIGSELTIALWFLVFGVGTAATHVGVEMGRRQSQRRQNTVTTAD